MIDLVKKVYWVSINIFRYSLRTYRKIEKKISQYPLNVNTIPKDLHHNAYSYEFEKLRFQGVYEIEGEIYSGNTSANKDVTIQVSFFDGNHNLLTMRNNIVGLNPKGQGMYQATIPCPLIKTKFKIFFTPVKKAKRVRITFESNHSRMYLTPFCKIEKIRRVKKYFALLLNEFMYRFSFTDTDYSDLPSYILENAEKYKMNPVYFSKMMFSICRDINPPLGSHVGKFVFSKNPTLKFGTLLVYTMHKAGSIHDKKKHAQQLIQQNFILDKMRLEKLFEEHDLVDRKYNLESIVPVSETYAKNNNVLYLLHNSLPYNSGGYATRTHGLIKNITDHSDFTVTGLARPGYPSDHKAHISQKLPSELPECQIVDGIRYCIGDQNFRRSHFTMVGNVNHFVDQIGKYVKKDGVSIVHAASNYPNGLSAVAAAKKYNIKSVYEVRGLWEITKASRDPYWTGTDYYNMTAILETQALQEADASITITNALKELMIKRGVDKEIHVVPNAVDTTQFTPRERDEDLARELGIANEVVIGYAGSIVDYEGLDDLLLACQKLLQDGVKNFKVLIVGDGAVHGMLKEIVKENDLQDVVTFTGRVSHQDVPRYISVMDIMPFPRKPFDVCEKVSPLKPFESLAMQKVVLVSSCQALTEIVQDEKTGLVFDKGDIEDLTKKLRTLIEDESLRNELAKNGLEWVRKERDWRVVAEKVTRIYESLQEKPTFKNKTSSVSIQV